MRRIKPNSSNSLEKKTNLILPKEDLASHQVPQEQKVLSKLAFNQLPLHEFSDKVKSYGSINALQTYKDILKENLVKFNSLYKQEKAEIKYVDVKSVEHLSGLYQETKNKLLESNIFHLIIQKLTIDYLMDVLKLKECSFETYKEVRDILASTYKAQLQLTLQETLISYNDLLLEYLFNESGELTISELLQLLTAINQHSNGLTYYVKTIPGTGDCYAQRDNSQDYIEVELKSADLEDGPLTKLLFKIQGNYLHLKESIFFLDGNKDQINNIIEHHNIVLPKNMEVNVINTKKIFLDNNYTYCTHKSKEVAFREIYESIKKPGFKKEVENLLKQSTTVKNKNIVIDLVKYQSLLKENYSLEWLEKYVKK